MKSCLIFTLLLFALWGCEGLTPPPPLDQTIYHIDNSSEFGLGGFNDGFNFSTRTINDKPDLILSPYINTEGTILGVMLYDQTFQKTYRLDFRFKESQREASHYYDNFELLKPIIESQKVFKFIPNTILTSNSYRYDVLEQIEYKAEKNDVWIFDDKIVLHIISTSFREDGYVSLHFKYRILREE